MRTESDCTALRLIFPFYWTEPGDAFPDPGRHVAHSTAVVYTVGMVRGTQGGRGGYRVVVVGGYRVVVVLGLGTLAWVHLAEPGVHLA